MKKSRRIANVTNFRKNSKIGFATTFDLFARKKYKKSVKIFLWMLSLLKRSYLVMTKIIRGYLRFQKLTPKLSN